MESFLEVLQITLPIFIVIGIGFVSVKFNVLHSQDIKSLAKFLINLGMPALLFSTVSQINIIEVMQLEFFNAYFLGSLLSFFTVFFVSIFLLKKSLSEASIYGMGSSLSNSTMIGFPVLTFIMGPAAAIPFAIVVIVENFIVIPLSLLIADANKKGAFNFANFVKSIVLMPIKNPMIIAIFLGLCFSLTGLKLQNEVVQSISLLAKTVAGLGLFIIGGMLIGFEAKGKTQDIALIVIAKLVIHPLSVILMIGFFPDLNNDLKTAALIFACVPMLSIFPVLGERYQLGAFCAATLVPSTILSFVSISVFIWLGDQLF